MVFRLSHMLVCLALASVLSLDVATTASAQQAGRWSPLDAEDGTGTGICDKASAAVVCLRLQCGSNRGLEISLFSNHGAFGDERSALIMVDGEEAARLSWTGEQASIPFDPAAHHTLLARLGGGRRAALAVNDRVFPLSLAGSAREIDRALSACRHRESVLAQGADTYGGRSERYRNEATMSFPPKDSAYEWSFTAHADTDIWGNDIRSGIDDPFLQSMTKAQCETLCSITHDCLYFTHNGRTDTCFLKSGVGRVERYAGATTGEFRGTRINFYPPPTRGRGTIVDHALSWRAGDTTAAWLRRVRDSARQAGAACDPERRIMEDVAAGFGLDWPQDASVTVGSGAKIAWTGNTLEDRVPLWLMVTSDRPVRFRGRGFFALGPDSINPFGFDSGAGRHRALVALHARGAGFEGELVVEPLVAAPIRLEASLVGYLRACEEEIVQRKGEATLTALPGAARLVLNNDLGRRAYTHEVRVEGLRRRILFNETRLLILDDTDGSEIVERAGSDLHVSPTHRFVVLRHDQKLDIVDLVDGETVARASPGEAFWGNGDSFFLTTSSPWGEVNIQSTFWDGVRIEGQVTGPSCCAASPDRTRIGIDLENAAIGVWDRLGWYVGALQNTDYAVGENAGSGYGSSQTGHDAIYHHALNSMGPVSPVSLARHWVASGAFARVSDWSDRYEGETHENQRERTNEEIVRLRLARVGLSAKTLDDRDGPDFAAPTGAERLANLLSRIGIELAQHEQGETLLGAPAYLNEFEMGLSVSDRQLRAETAMDDLRKDAIAHGWTLEWTVPDKDLISECDHIVVGESGGFDSKPGNYAPGDVVEVHRVGLAGGNVWLARSDCSAGATFGTLRGTSGLYLYDLGRPFSGSISQVEVATNGYMTNVRSPAFFEHELRVNAAAHCLIVHAPGNGMIAVYDRDTRTFVWIGEGLADGDLLRDAFMTADLRHVVQFNSDGGVHLHRVNDGKHLMAGRIVDDELAVWLDDFRFDATAEAAALVDLRFPGRAGQYSLDRFGSARRIAGLAELVISARDVPQAGEARMPPDIAGTVHKREDGQIDIEIESASEGATSVSVFQDGVLTGTYPLADPPGRDTISVSRMKGARWIAAMASDAKGLTSLPIARDLGEPGAANAVNRALIVGINTYDDPAIPSLNFALRDGGRFAETLASFPEAAPTFDTIGYLKDTAATPEAILDGVEALLEGLGKGDHAVLFFAGHGFRSAEGEFHFGTSGTELGDIAGTALAFRRVSGLLEETEARITIILDACHAGAADNPAFATNDDAVTDLARLRSNITILAASKGRELSQESAELGGGVFTFALAQVLGEDRARHDTNGNGRIEAQELYLGVKRLVVSQRQGLQTPWMVRSRMVGDYALF